MKKRVSLPRLLAVALLLAALLTSCGAANGSYVADAESPAMSIEPQSILSYNKVSSEDADVLYSLVDTAETSVEQKMIYTGSMSLETKSFDECIKALEKAVTDRGGYIGSSKVYGTSYGSSKYYRRTASYVFRIPAAELKATTAAFGEICNVVSSGINADDVSDTYYDLAARLKSYETQEARLLELLGKSEDLKSLLEVEDKLSEVRYNIERITAQLRSYDNRITYSTLSVTLEEVVDYTDVTEEPESYLSRLWDSVCDSWADFTAFLGDALIWFVAALPTLVFLAVIVLVIVLLVKRGKKKRLLKAQARFAAEQEAKNK